MFLSSTSGTNSTSCVFSGRKSVSEADLQGKVLTEEKETGGVRGRGRGWISVNGLLYSDCHFPGSVTVGN